MDFLLIGAGIVTGILVHDLGLLAIIAATRRVMSRKAIRVSSILTGLALIGFSGYFVYQFVTVVQDFL